VEKEKTQVYYEETKKNKVQGEDREDAEGIG
jgi:hypothetical protein